MVQFGRRAGDSIKRDQESSSDRGPWMFTLKDGVDFQVRFLEEPADWTRYKEHFSQEIGRYFPCSQDDECPGCNSENERTQRVAVRYLANVVDVKENTVVPLKMPRELANRLQSKAERNGGTILSRDYILIRTGSGLETTYEVEAADKSPLDRNRYVKQLHNMEDLLKKSWESAHGWTPPKVSSSGSPWGDDGSDEAQSKEHRAKARQRYRQTMSLPAAGKPEPNKAVFVPPSDNEDDEEIITFEKLEGYSRSELVDLAFDLSLDFDEQMSTPELRELIKTNAS